VTGRFSFEVVNAVDYDELRPSYAPEAAAWVAGRGSLRGGSIVVDLAAGTGQLSRRFADLGVDLVAVEPAANMRAVLEERLPAIRIVDGAAEQIPLPDGSVDAVVVGNAFHHFERRAAFAEIHRVLRPEGALALFWAWPLEEEQLSIPGVRRSTRRSRERARRTRSRRPTGRGQRSPTPPMGSVRSNGVSFP
jgi:SAM-dependent methyltransferase